LTAIRGRCTIIYKALTIPQRRDKDPDKRIFITRLTITTVCELLSRAAPAASRASAAGPSCIYAG